MRGVFITFRLYCCGQMDKQTDQRTNPRLKRRRKEKSIRQKRTKIKIIRKIRKWRGVTILLWTGGQGHPTHASCPPPANIHKKQLKHLYSHFCLVLTDWPIDGQSLYQSCVSATKMKQNKVIRPKSRALALSKKVKQTDRQTILLQKDIWNGHLLHKISFLPFRDI